MGWQISKHEVKSLFDKIFAYYELPKQIYVRNDNGSQFEATLIQDYFKDKGVVQEFTLPATPEQNAHIESYHSIIERVLCRRYELEDLIQAQEIFNRWIKFYNFERIHSGIQYVSPSKFLLANGVDMQWDDQLELTLDCKPFFIT